MRTLKPAFPFEEDGSNQTTSHNVEPVDFTDWTIVQPMGSGAIEGGRTVQVWSGSVSSVVRLSVEQINSSLEWIVILASVLAGLLLLAVLILILWAVSSH